MGTRRQPICSRSTIESEPGGVVSRRGESCQVGQRWKRRKAVGGGRKGLVYTETSRRQQAGISEEVPGLPVARRLGWRAREGEMQGSTKRSKLLLGGQVQARYERQALCASERRGPLGRLFWNGPSTLRNPVATSPVGDAESREKLTHETNRPAEATRGAGQIPPDTAPQAILTASAVILGRGKHVQRAIACWRMRCPFQNMPGLDASPPAVFPAKNVERICWGVLSMSWHVFCYLGRLRLAARDLDAPAGRGPGPTSRIHASHKSSHHRSASSTS